ncbi:MAG: DUF58 domain-containing protein [Chloroflexi bacterium]|nr:DUF58 domain-containing protein [Chloroflexota bacterium]
MSQKAFFLFALAFALIILGVITRLGSLIILAILFCLYPIVGWLRRPEEIHLRVTRRLSDHQSPVGTPVEVHLTIKNEGDDLDELLVEDVLPRRVENVEGETRLLTSLKHGEKVEFSYTITCQRGSYAFPLIRVTACDTLGIFTFTRTFETEGRLVVLPQAQKIRSPMIRPQRTIGFAGPVPSREGGTGTDFFALREYQVGDPRRRINWRVSARHDQELFTNEFELERIAPVGLILDAREQSNPETPWDSFFEYSVQAAMSLAAAFINQGNRVALLVYGESIHRIFPGYGKVQLERIQRTLAEASPGHNYALEKLDYLPTRFFPARSQIVLISPLVARDIPVLTRLRALGYALMVVSPDPVSYEAKAMGESVKGKLAVRIAQIERRLLLQNLQRTGIQVINWPIDRSFQEIIDRTLWRIPESYQRIISPV